MTPYIVFVGKIIWITIKYMPIFIAWIVMGIVGFETASEMYAAYQQRTFSLVQQLILLVGFWFLVTGAAAASYVFKK